jgi:hypothetical protein
MMTSDLIVAVVLAVPNLMLAAGCLWLAGRS